MSLVVANIYIPKHRDPFLAIDPADPPAEPLQLEIELSHNILHFQEEMYFLL